MTQSNDIANRVAQLESGQIELRLVASALLATVEQHQVYHETSQRNFETIQRNIETIQRSIETMQAEIKGLQLENQRILDRLLGESDTDENLVG
jgi:uncharacterized protein YoxC